MSAKKEICTTFYFLSTRLPIKYTYSQPSGAELGLFRFLSFATI